MSDGIDYGQIALSREIWEQERENLRRKLCPGQFAAIEDAYGSLDRVEASRLGDTVQPHTQTLMDALTSITTALGTIEHVLGRSRRRERYLNWTLAGRSWRLFVPEALWRAFRGDHE